MLVKICGLCRQQDIEYANEAQPDYVGFVFWDKSRRYVTRDQAAQLKKRLDSHIKVAGVFVDESPDIVLQLFSDGIIDIAQLHGAETEEEIRWLKKKSGRPVWKAAIVKSAADVGRWRLSQADMVLFDGGRGEGRTFLWEHLSGFDRSFFLAGGMSLERLKSIKRHPFLTGIDVSSGVETDGIKDREKMRYFVQQVRSLGEAFAV